MIQQEGNIEVQIKSEFSQPGDSSVLTFTDFVVHSIQTYARKRKEKRVLLLIFSSPKVFVY